MSESALARARRDQKIADEVSSENPTMACMICHAPTKTETLSMYGARCFKCYTRYLREVGPQTPPPRYTREDKLEILRKLRESITQQRPSLEWAHRLRDREQSGESLTKVQRESWRAALHEVAA